MTTDAAVCAVCVLQSLAAVSAVPRFDTVLEFIADGDKQSIAALFDRLSLSGASSDIDAVRGKYLRVECE